MPERVCPWWLGYFLASPIRRWLTDPTAVIQPYVHEGMTVLEPGPGMGFFTMELARRVGPKGRVVAVDVQPKMIAGLKRRGAKAGMLDRIDARVSPPESMVLNDLAGAVDFTLAFAMVHEMPDATRFFAEAAAASRPGAKLLLAEPAGHVKDAKFDEELQAARQAGFVVVELPKIRHSKAALLKKEAA